MSSRRKSFSRQVFVGGALVALGSSVVVAPAWAVEGGVTGYVPVSSEGSRLILNPQSPVKLGFNFGEGAVLAPGVYEVKNSNVLGGALLGVVSVNGESVPVKFEGRGGVGRFEIKEETRITDQTSGVHLTLNSNHVASHRAYDTEVTLSHEGETLASNKVFARVNPVFDEPQNSEKPATDEDLATPSEPNETPETPNTEETEEKLGETNVSPSGVATFTYSGVTEGDYTLVTEIRSQDGELLKTIETPISVEESDGEEDVDLGNLPVGTYTVIQTLKKGEETVLSSEAEHTVRSQSLNPSGQVKVEKENGVTLSYQDLTPGETYEVETRVTDPSGDTVTHKGTFVAGPLGEGEYRVEQAFEKPGEYRVVQVVKKGEDSVLELSGSLAVEGEPETPPVEPEQPTEPEVPTEPTDPEPVDPVEPSEPTEPEVPVEPTDPVEPVEPEKPVEPVEPVDPTPTDPVEPEVPTDPTEPTNPVEPVEPVEPTNPVEPTEPEKPVNPTPTDPTEPVTPVEPTEPTNPVEPETPSEPAEPQPALPVAPDHNEDTLEVIPEAPLTPEEVAHYEASDVGLTYNDGVTGRDNAVINSDGTVTDTQGRVVGYVSNSGIKWLAYTGFNPLLLVAGLGLALAGGAIFYYQRLNKSEND